MAKKTVKKPAVTGKTATKPAAAGKPAAKGGMPASFADHKFGKGKC